MGPYYLTALVSLLGPIQSVTAMARISFPEREITSEPKRGKRVKVETPTHICGVMRFASGPIVTLTTSFDVWHAQTPPIEIYGSEGTISVPDPNTFGGPVRLRLKGESEWREAPLTHAHAENSRGIGISDMVDAIQSNRPQRAGGLLANHVLEAMHGFLQSSEQGTEYELKTTVDQPAALPAIGS
jgi:predicted dehydrogenase